MFETPNQKTQLCQNFEETMIFKTWFDLEQNNMLEREREKKPEREREREMKGGGARRKESIYKHKSYIIF